MRLSLYRKYVLISTFFAVIAHIVSGSTFGSITNEEGKFELETSYLPCQLVASHISYAPFNKLVDAESRTSLTIRLIPYQHEIREISIAAESMRKENLELFINAFIGTDEIARSCSILNDSVLSFSWDSLVFLASAYQPVLIDNPKLGYRINIILDDFKLIYDLASYKRIHKRNKLKPDVTGAVYQTLCDFHFIPYPPGKKGEQKSIEKTRLRAYYGSRMHFLRSLYSGKLKANGYLTKPYFHQASITAYTDSHAWHGIRFVFLDPEGYPDKMLTYPDEPVVISFFENNYGIPVDLNLDSGDHLIPLQSGLTFGSKKCLVRYNGTTFDYSLIFSGHIGGQRISTMLPNDFMPDD